MLLISKSLLKKCWIIAATLIITLAILFSLFRVLTPWAKQYKSKVEQHLSVMLGQPVTISNMETSWYWFEPVLKLKQVHVTDRQNHHLKLKKLLVGINLLSSLWHWEIQPGVLYLDGVELTVRQVDKHWQIDGLRYDKQTMMLNPDSYLLLLAWLFAQQKIIIKHVSATIYLSDGTLLPFTDLHLTAANNSGHYQLWGGVKLTQTSALTELSILADLHVDPYALSKVDGHVYLAAKNIFPAQWQGFLPKTGYHLNNAQGNFEVWLDVADSRLTELQTKFNFHDIAWQQGIKTKQHFVQSLQANLDLKCRETNWQLSGDKIILEAGGVRWPENTVLLNYNKISQAYRLYIRKILLRPLFATAIEWPEMMKPLTTLNLEGELTNVQLGFLAHKINYFMARFTHLGWQSKASMPGVTNLSGVLHWQPLEGRLELDAEHAVINPKKLPAVTFSQINAAMDWQQLKQGLHINLKRVIFSGAGLFLNAQGVVDEFFSPAKPRIQLNLEFSADEAQKWLAYLPYPYLKPKLGLWLKENIKRIGQARGEVNINGALADFPFDKQPGEFSIKARLSEFDLWFNKQWPLARDVDAYLHVDKRNLAIDILHANLKQILIDKMNLRMDAIGLGQETMLVHGKIQASASKMKALVIASPLQKKLAKLKVLTIQGPIDLDLRLEIPLYPENNEVLGVGRIVFDKNPVTVHHALNDINIDNFSGTLHFNEQGIKPSNLQGTLLDNPMEIHIQSMHQAKPYTEISIDSMLNINLLKNKTNFYALSFLQGQTNVSGLIKLTEDLDDFDHVIITSSLDGLAIDLPPPFGKKINEKIPFHLLFDFNAKAGLRVRSEYKDRVSSDVWFAPTNPLQLKNGQLRFGKGVATNQAQEGIYLVGTLPAFDWPRWKEIIDHLPLASPSHLTERIRGIDLLFDSVTFLKQNYKKMRVKATWLAKDDWQIKLQQEAIAATLRYQKMANLLSGNLAYIDITKTLVADANSGPSTLTPMQIPNLDLTVDLLRFKTIDVGSGALKSSSTKDNWHLEYAKINSPAYQLTATGHWLQSEQHNNTDLQFELKINDLAQSLVRWDIAPVVEANSGNVRFKGGWSGAIDDFALAKMKGDLYIKLKNGRITHLSHETEEKLGLGKLLSVLSLQTIPRRLKLDFSDLSKGGYSFDEFKGNFILKNGVMNTTDSAIEGPVAYAGMKGDLDIVKHLYNIELHISPHITASLPIVATIAGGPIAGFATWAASKIINRGMQKISGYTYKISGSWQDPAVEQIKIFKMNHLGDVPRILLQTP